MKIHDLNSTQNKQTADVDVLSLPDVTCDKCGHTAFYPAFLMKKVSAILSESGKPGYNPIQVFACAKCGHVNDEFNPTAKKIQGLN